MYKMRRIEKRNDYILRISMFILFFFFVSLSFIFIKIPTEIKTEYEDTQINPKFSALGGYTNLTNTELNNTRFPHGSTFGVEGYLINASSKTGISGYNVFIFINGTLNSNYYDTTDGTGYFNITYIIPNDLDVFKSYKLEVNVTSKIKNQDIRPFNYYIFYVNASSFLKITYHETLPKAEGENFYFQGYLKYDSQNGRGIPNSQINFYWYNNTYKGPIGSISTDLNGNFSESLTIPDYISSDYINLLLNFSTVPGYINGSIEILEDIKIFSNISCIWAVNTSLQVGQQISISGELTSMSNPSIKINGRQIRVYYNGTLIHASTTNTIGIFSFSFTIPSGTGIAEFKVELVTSLAVEISNSTYITISAAPSTPSAPPQIPFLGFLSIFLPILFISLAVLAGYGFYYYKKNISGKRVVNVPLESKIINLKILRDTGRIEESVSYLFNAIFMELIQAKFGRVRTETETIKDFAIISVNKFKLDPSIIYPFIEKIEEIIYARPNKATEEDFYTACDFFSPLYKSLTGYNFVLNF